MLILSSILSFSQSTNTKDIYCFDSYRIEQIYKGLKQGEFLKDKLKDAELTINLGDTLIREQAKQIENQNFIIGIQEKEKETLNYRLKLTEEKNLKKDMIHQNELKIMENKSKDNFKRGLKTGGIIGAAIVTVAVILIN